MSSSVRLGLNNPLLVEVRDTAPRSERSTVHELRPYSPGLREFSFEPLLCC